MSAAGVRYCRFGKSLIKRALYFKRTLYFHSRALYFLLQVSGIADLKRASSKEPSIFTEEPPYIVYTSACIFLE